MTYYIDGLDIPFDSLGDIEHFLLSLRQPSLLYLLTLDRYVYYGDLVSNMFMCCGYLRIGHTDNPKKRHYFIHMFRIRDSDVYRSRCIVPFTRCFINVSNRTTKSPLK